MLSRISKRLEALKKDECRNLVNKLVRDTDWHAGNVEGIYIYDIRRMSNENCDDTDAIIVNNALNTYGAGEKYEYPLLVYDSTRGSNGKKGFVLTPDHIYYNSSMTAGTIKISEAGGFYIETGLFNKGIYVKKGSESLKITGNIKGDKNVLDLYLKQLNKFIKYLKEKPESRNVEYLAKEKHDVKCCTRCGYVFKSGSICPKCGSRNE
jgi:rubrerythrin